ncbi:MAG: ATP-dependent helicase [Nannocystaceae bacterium]
MSDILSASPRPNATLHLAHDLNEEQRAVVEADPQPLLVLAGAGTGKTRTLTYRVARLVARGCPPPRLMLMTFTNRASREMIMRVQRILAVDMRQCAAGTFHHVGNRLLRQYADTIGISSDFGILDPEDCRDLLSGLIAERGLHKLSTRRFPSAKALHAIVSLSAGTRIAVEEVLRRSYPRFVEQTATIVQLAEAYAARKMRINVCDFDDLLVLWLRLLQHGRRPQVQELLGRFDHILVDEYQDTNALQGAIADAMASHSRSLTCVGDDAQSIYDFRGADVGQMLGFKQRHPDARLMTLTLSYRSIPEVLALSNRSIAHNKEQHQKSLRPVRAPGPRPALLALRDVFQQAEFVAQRVIELHHERGIGLGDVAVLYRNHSHSLELQVELTRRKIPFVIRSGTRFFEQAHVKDVIAFLRARANPHDELAWNRLLRLWPGMGMQTAQRLAEQLSKNSNAPSAPSAFEWATREGTTMVRDSMQRLTTLWSALDGMGETGPAQTGPSEQIRTIVEHHYGAYADHNFTDAPRRREDLKNLASFATRYARDIDLLRELALMEGIVVDQDESNQEPGEKLVLSTIHQAKGLQWRHCFVLWLARGKFPAMHTLRSARSMEEERRLFYVAVTRAADELYLCYPTLDEGHATPLRLMTPSPFVTELDHDPPVMDQWEIEETPA